MKTKIIISFVLVISVMIFVSSKYPAKKNVINKIQTINTDTAFFIGCYDMGYVTDRRILDSAKFNQWHKYLGGSFAQGRYVPKGWFDDDITFTNPNNLNDVKSLLDSNYNQGIQTFMQRPNIEWLCFGQRSDYQCEDSCFLSDNKKDLWFYTYRNVGTTGVNYQDNSQFGNGVHVKYCKTSGTEIDPCDNTEKTSSPGYVVKGLKANREQINATTYPGVGDWQYKWYIKPRIRINVADAFANKKICRVEIYNYEGDTIKKVELFGKNFIDNNNNYNGTYLENYFRFEGDTNLIIDTGYYFNPHKHNWMRSDDSCKVDFRVYWYGQCDMWIDYVRVDDEKANRLLTGSDDEFNNMLDWEAQLAVSKSSPIRFYLDEFEFNHLPCLKYVSKRLREKTAQLGREIPFSIYNSHGWLTVQTPGCVYLPEYYYKKYFIDSVKIKENMFGSYPFKYWQDNIPSKIPNTLPNLTNPGVWGDQVSPGVYDEWLQGYLDGGINYPNAGEFLYAINLVRNPCIQSDINFIVPIQTHIYWKEDHLREPTNQELDLLVNLSLSFGSRGISYFWYGSFGQIGTYGSGAGIADFKNGVGFQPRYLNVYNQFKWEKIKEINGRLTKWKKYLQNLSLANNNSHIYRIDTSRTSLSGNSCFSRFVTFRPGNGTPQCTEDNTPDGLTNDCQNETYLQIATFGSIENNSYYFMVVNRRCSPYRNDYNDDSVGGRRKIRASLHSNYSAFSDFKNWSIVNCENDSVIAIFNKSNPGYVNLDWFMPGEGRLYKIAPAMETGGTLVCNEDFNTDVICKKSVYANGYNITIGTNANISFADSVGIYMSGGNLTIGNIYNNPSSSHLQFKGITSNNKWQGFVLDSCGVVQVYGGYFNNIMQNQSAFNVSNCFHYRFENNHFTCAQGENSNGININYSISLDDESNNAYHYIKNNIFDFTGNSNYAINITASGSASIPVLIESNTLNTFYGIFVENISGGAINQNSISNYTEGITLLSSNCDFFHNTLASSETDATGIKLLLSTSGISPTSSNGYFVGGYNNLSSLGSNSSNIKVEDSYFDIDNGYNLFDIDFEYSPRHITGYFPSTSESEYKARYNCFNNNSVVDTASIYVTQGSGEEANSITFITDPTYCGTQELANYEVFNLSGNINDTIYYRSGGTGGGYKDGQAMAIETQTTYKLLKDSISINLRKHFYNLSELECREMLLNYPDSSESIGMVSKLYLSSLTIDSAGNHIQNTKTFFENLILNNPNNTPLIKRANYFVQKCKVALKQYTSALQGFQEIINQNPYSYEGLIASWDYAATQLLANSGGSYPNEEAKSNEEESEIISYNINYLLDSLRNKKTSTTSYSTENYDTKKFTKQDRESINSNVTNAFKNERTKQIEKIQELEKKITTLSNSNSKTKPKTKNDELVLSNAKKELKTMKTLSEVVKVKKPKNINEHIKNINSDIKKVFTIEKTSGSSKTNNLIPLEYNLSQNYPNPFNPVTKINYELPKDGKVRLVIYDILGRQIKSLVNNEFKTAGRYTVEFNGTQYASGVYFYRIQVEDGKGFTAVKKMVLVK